MNQRKGSRIVCVAVFKKFTYLRSCHSVGLLANVILFSFTANATLISPLNGLLLKKKKEKKERGDSNRCGLSFLHLESQRRVGLFISFGYKL